MKPGFENGLKTYRGMDRATLDAAYNNRAAVADSGAWLQRWCERSALVRADGTALLGVRYGLAPRAVFDYFPCGRSGAPLFVFIHGGYWQTNDKTMFAFIADGPRSVGMNVATIGYTLAPDVSLSEIVEEVRAAVTYLSARAAGLGFDPNRIIVGGWSAGGHLAAMLVDHRAVMAVLAISGIFDLEPIALCYVNDAIHLSQDDITRLSPARRPHPGCKPISIACGGGELPELQRQSIEFAALCKTKEPATRLVRLDAHHHFSILDELGSVDGALTRELRSLSNPGRFRDPL